MENKLLVIVLVCLLLVLSVIVLKNNNTKQSEVVLLKISEDKGITFSEYQRDINGKIHEVDILNKSVVKLNG